MVEIVRINTDEPYWKMDVSRAISLFKMEHGVDPCLTVGNNFIGAVMKDQMWLGDKCMDFDCETQAYYKGYLLRYDPDITCVILTDGREEKTCYNESFCEGRECGECVFR